MQNHVPLSNTVVFRMNKMYYIHLHLWLEMEGNIREIKFSVISKYSYLAVQCTKPGF
jgi:hypothetical protein